MASGRVHDRATRWLALPFGLLWAPSLGERGVLVAGLAFLVGGLWLSPDLDTHSKATQRWGPLRGLWFPYRQLIRHRSLLSHSPFLGTAGRLLYLGGLLAITAVVLASLLGNGSARLGTVAMEIWTRHRSLLLAAVIGVEASGWLHLLLDGDPEFHLPRPLRKHRRRRPSQK